MKDTTSTDGASTNFKPINGKYGTSQEYAYDFLNQNVALELDGSELGDDPPLTANEM